MIPDTETLREAVLNDPDNAIAHYNLGHELAKLRHYTESYQQLSRACELMPASAQIHNALGYVLNKQGRNSEALDYFRRALQLDPGFVAAHDNLVYYLHYDYDCSPEEMYQAHRNWNKRHAIFLQSRWLHKNTADPGKTLRIGYVSADFRTHSVARFLEPLFSNHDHKAVETWCYADIEHTDNMTERLTGYATAWHNIRDLTDEELATKIRSDSIDILVDLGGHTANNRLLTFARKPAPVQVSWLGYPDTTGLTSIDYRITDDIADPPGQTDNWYTETLIRLPGGFLCYQPPSGCNPVAPAPMAVSKSVTFGSFNALPKISEQVITSWSSILKAVPGSRLMLKNKSFMDKGTRQYCCRRFQVHGIDPDRLQLLGWVAGVNAHMGLYENIDIALDTFPYNGATTTCEALWMGVPVLTLQGRTHVERVGSSLLTRVGLEDWIGKDGQQYVQKAAEFSRAPQRLESVRKGMRDRIRQSSLCNGRDFAHNMEQAFRSMWAVWCRQQHNV